jgi:hypothetical protein
MQKKLLGGERKGQGGGVVQAEGPGRALGEGLRER